METVVPNIRTLKAMERAGLIMLHRDTGEKVRHWTGKTVRAYYIDDVRDGVKQPFVYKKKHYKLKYFDGCFCPFVVYIENAEQLRVDLSKTFLA